jgi:stage III sporulation protein AD
MIKIIGVAFVASLAAILLRSTKPELAFVITVTGIVVCLIFIFDALKGSLQALTSIGQMTGVDNGLIRILLKIVGIAYVTEFSAGVLSDFGSASVADKVLLGGKLTILVMSFPIIEGLLELLKGFLQLV